MTKATIYIQIEEGADLPHAASADSAGVDLRTIETMRILPGQTVMVPTGIRLALPSGTEAQVRPRSGLSLKSRLRIVNSPGTIDADFRDEVKILLMNQFSQSERLELLIAQSPLLERFGKVSDRVTLLEWYRHEKISTDLLTQNEKEQVILLNELGDPWGTEIIQAGDRVAQLVIASHVPFSFELTDDVRRYGQDRGGGFGHSGMRELPNQTTDSKRG